MRTLLISDVTGYMRGGVPEEIRLLATGMHSRGHAIGYCGDLPILSGGGVQHFPLTIESVQRLQTSVSAAVASFRPDLVHIMALSSGGVRALLPILGSRPWLLTCHSIPPYERKLSAFHANEQLHYFARGIRFFPHSLAWRFLLTRGSVPTIVTHSRWVSDVVCRYGFPSARTREILIGIDAGIESIHRLDITPSLGFPRIVTVGGIAHTKGQHDAVRAISSLLSDFPNLSYQIIGEVRDPSYLTYLRSLIDRVQLSGHVSIGTNVDEQSKQHALRSADLYVQPSHEEGFCLAYIEAASKVPRLIGTDTGAIRQVSQGDEGMQVVPPRAPLALASAIRALLRKPLSAGLMSWRVERLALDFSWKGYLDEHETLYHQLVSASVPPELSTT
jgi:glycosyltransferase involved in cell wall biosynthesis